MLKVDFLNVGQGDCSVLTLPNGKLILIDVGGRGSPLVDWLAEVADLSIHALILTHNDADHAGALPSVLEHFGQRIEHFFMLQDRATTDPKFVNIFRRALEWQRPDRPIQRLEAGANIWSDAGLNIELTVVHPTFAENITASRPNLTSGILCLKLHGKTEIIWPGDATLRAVATHCNGAAPVVLVGPHHGGPADYRHPSATDHISAIAPRRAYLSVGTNNSFQHPRPRYVQQLERHGCRVVCSQLTVTL